MRQLELLDQSKLQSTPVSRAVAVARDYDWKYQSSFGKPENMRRNLSTVCAIRAA